MIISELKRIFLNEKSYQNGTGAYPEVSPFKKKNSNHQHVNRSAEFIILDFSITNTDTVQ